MPPLEKIVDVFGRSFPHTAAPSAALITPIRPYADTPIRWSSWVAAPLRYDYPLAAMRPSIGYAGSLYPGVDE